MYNKSLTFSVVIVVVVVGWFICDVICTDDTAPPSRSHFTVEPKSAYVRRGDSVTLTCDVTDDLDVTGWLHDGQPVTSSRHLTVAAGTLRIASFYHVGREGLYQCVANGSAGALLSRPAALYRAVLESYDQRLPDREVNVTAGNVAVIPCAASPRSTPSAVSQFEFNGARLRLTARHRILPSGNLQIEAVTEADQGVYRCIAVNPVSLDRQPASNTVKLLVNYVPDTSSAWSAARFSWTPLTTIEVKRSDTLTLECVADGWPVPDVTWYKHGGVLPATRHRQINGNLVIDGVEKGDEGTYVCRADNQSGQPPLAHVTTVEVLEPPTIVMPPSDRDINEGGTVKFHCSAAGTTPMSIKWFHNAMELSTAMAPQLSKHIQFANQSLIVSDVQSSHAGFYQCFVNNSVGRAMAFAHLDVISLATPTSKSFAGSTARPTRRRPLPTNPVVIPTQRADNALLRVGYQSIPAESGYHKTELEIDESAVRGPTRLVPPPRPSVSMLSETSVSLAWTPWSLNSGSNVRFLKVQYREMSSDRLRTSWNTLEDDVVSSASSHTVTGLKPGNTYQFRLVAVYTNNDNKHGPNSGRLTLTSTKQQSCTPSVSPIIVKVVPQATSLTVYWQYEPSEHEPVIDGFELQYRLYSTGSGQGYAGDYIRFRKLTVPGGVAVRRMTIIGLKPRTSYSMRITCFNSCGHSDFSNTAVKSTLAAVAAGSRDSNINVNGNVRSNTAGQEDQNDDIWDLDDDEDDDADDQLLSHDQQYEEYADDVTIEQRNAASSWENNEMVFVIVGVVVGVVVALAVVVVVCVWKLWRRRHRSSHSAAVQSCDSCQLKNEKGLPIGPLRQSLLTDNNVQQTPLKYIYSLKHADTDCQKQAQQQQQQRVVDNTTHLSVGSHSSYSSEQRHDHTSDVDSLLATGRVITQTYPHVQQQQQQQPFGYNHPNNAHHLQANLTDSNLNHAIYRNGYHLPVRYHDNERHIDIIMTS